MSPEDSQRLDLTDGEPIVLRNQRGEFHGHVKIDRVKPGSLQGYWPEVNVLVAAGCLDPSGVPDYNAIVEVVAAGRAQPARAMAAAAD